MRGVIGKQGPKARDAILRGIRRSPVRQGVSNFMTNFGTAFSNTGESRDLMLGCQPRSSPVGSFALPDKMVLDDPERGLVAARLDDMRRTLGDRDFDQLVAKARVELLALSGHAPPWSPVVAQRGLNIAMLLGLDRLELACRAIIHQPSDEISAAAAKAADAAAKALAALQRG